MRYLNPSISSLELSWVIFHLKISLRNVAIYGAYKWPKFFIYPPGEISFSSPCSYQSNLLFFVSGRISPHNFEMLSISPQQAYSFVVDFPTTPCNPYLQGCFPSSFVAEVVIFFSVPLSQQSSFYSFVPQALWCCSIQPIISFLSKSMFFPLLIHSTGVLCPLLKFFSSYQVLHLFSSGVLFEFVLPCSSFLTKCFQLRSSPLFFFSQNGLTSQGSWLSLVYRRNNLVLPLRFLFRFSPVQS